MQAPCNITYDSVGSFADELFILGADTEFVPGPKGNRIQSYQTHGMYRGREWSWFEYRDGKRMTLEEVIGAALEKGKQDGVFKHYPEEVHLAMHWSLADLTMFKNFEQLKDQFDALRKTYATILKPCPIRWTDRNGHQRDLAVFLHDTLLLAPQGRGLKALGDMHGLPKLELPPGMIERMDEFWVSDPVLFREYAIRDAMIAAKHAHYMAQLGEQWTGRKEIPVSLGSLAVNTSLQFWKRNQVDYPAALGFQIKKKEIFVRDTYRTIEEKVALPGYSDNEALAKAAYHGGWNEAYFFGATPVGNWSDWDLAGAYSTVLASVGTPLYDRVYPSINLADYLPGSMGFARVEFEFPEGVRFPCLAVSTDHGLCFPRHGVTCCTASEIWQAVQLGANITILKGIIVPMGPAKPFGEVIKHLTQERRAHKGDALLDALFKELVNSLYGKTAQGLRPKKAFNSRTGFSALLPESKITNAFFAAHVTGGVRAVLGEVLNSLPSSRQVVSVTTDGFITAATEAEVLAAATGPLATMFSKAREELCGDRTMLERKHGAAQVLCWRTRGQATLQKQEGQKPMLAQGGLKPPEDVPKGGANDWIVASYVTRNADTKCEVRYFRSLREIWHDGGDLTKKSITRTVGMDFDFKRKPVDPGRQLVGEEPMLTFQTVPWDTFEDFLHCRDQWERFRRQTGRCLRTEDDYSAFQDFLISAGANTVGLNRSLDDGSVALAQRLFLRAFMQSAWGLRAGAMTQRELAQWLTGGGYKTSITDVKNAGRAGTKLFERIVPRTAETYAFADFVREQFPDFRDQKIFQTPAEKTYDEVPLDWILDSDLIQNCENKVDFAVLDSA